MNHENNPKERLTNTPNRKNHQSISFDSIYQDYFDNVFHYIYNRTGNSEDAEDITSQIFLSILERLPKYKDNGHLAAWVFTIARHKLIDHYRKNKKLTKFDENNFTISDEKMIQTVIHKEHVNALNKVLNNLSANEKELIRLRILGELKFSDIARILKRSESSVKKAYYRLIQRIKHRLEVSNG
jgi:RNA polymerase sigma-70 factor (ECF subfamily)